MKHSSDDYTDEYGLYPPGSGDNNVGARVDLPPGHNAYCSSATPYSSEGYTDEDSRGFFDDDDLEYGHSAAKKHSSTANNEKSCTLATELEEHLDATGQNFKIPYLSSEEQLTEGAEILKKLTPRKVSDSKSMPPPAMEQVKDSPSLFKTFRKEGQSTLSGSPGMSPAPGTRRRSRATTAASSNGPVVFSTKSSRRNTAQTTDTTDAMEEDEVMCQGIV